MQNYQCFNQEDSFQNKKENFKTQELTPWENINTNIITNQFRKNKSHVNTENQSKIIKKCMPKFKNMSHNYTRSKDHQNKLYTNCIKREINTTMNSPKQSNHFPVTKVLQQINLNVENRNTVRTKKSSANDKNLEQFQIYNSKNSARKNLLLDQRRQTKRLLENSLEENKKIIYQNDMKNIKIHRKTKEQLKIKISMQNDWLRKYISKKFPERHKNRQQLLYLPEVTKKLYQKYSFSKNHKYLDDRIKLLPL